MSPEETRPEMTAEETAAGERPPFWIVGLGLLGLVFVVLAGAFLLNRRARPDVGIESTPPIAGVAQATAPAVPAPTTPAASATPTATVSAVPTTVGVATSPLEREIENAYLHYWDVLAQAFLSLDPSRLAEATSGAELTRQEQQVRELRTQSRAAKLVVDHHLTFLEVASDRAVIYDEYLNRSVFVDLVTKRELPTKEPPGMEKISFQMRKINGVWKVVDGRRHD